MGNKISNLLTYKNIYTGLLILSLIVMLWMSTRAAISGDEFRYYTQAKKVYNYFATNGEDKSATKKTGIDIMHYNVQSFDVIMYAFEKWFGVKDPFTMRHMFNALSGWFIILFTSLMALRILGYKAAILTLILLFVSPRLLGHSFNNNGDIPTVVSFVFTMYCLFFYYKQYPKIYFKTILLLTLGIASAFSTKLAPGILLVAFVSLYIVLYHIYQTRFKNILKKDSIILLLKLVGLSMVISLVGLMMSMLIWPFALEDPLKNIAEVFKASSNLQIYINQLFEGKLIKSNMFPWYSVPKLILLTIPIIVLIGCLLYLGISVKEKFKQFTFYQFTFIFTIFFPIIYSIVKLQNDYGSWRHFIFIYPFIVLLAVIGWMYLINMQTKKIRIGTIVVLAVLIFLPLRFIAQNHPYHYVYFNELVGGVKKAYTRYETDYFCTGIYGGTKWLKKNILPKISKNKNKLKIISNAGSHAVYYFRKDTAKVEVQYSRYYEKSEKDWDYAIFYCSYISPYQLKKGYWPPKGTIHTERVDGAPIGVVIKRSSREDFKGFQALEKRNINSAVKHFNNYLKFNPHNEEVYSGLAKAHYMGRDFKKVIAYADSALSYHPDYIYALYLKSIAQNSIKDYQGAVTTADYLLQLSESISGAYYQKGFALYALGKPNDAIKTLNKAIAIKRNFYEAYMLLGNIFINYQKYDNAEHVFNNLLKVKKNDGDAYVQLAYCYHFQKNNPKAEAILNKFNDQSRNNFHVQKLYARIYIDKEQFTQANQILQQFDQITHNTDLFVVKALYLMKTGKINEAKKNLQTALTLDNQNYEAKVLLHNLLTSTKKPAKNKPEKKQKSVLLKKKK